MTKWLKQIQDNKTLQNLILVALFGLLFFLPEQYPLTEIAYVPILFFIAYISSYIQISPIRKGLFYSLVVTAIVVAAFLSIITMFPTIPDLLLLVIIAVIATLSTYFIG